MWSFRGPSVRHGQSPLLRKPFVCASEESWASADTALSMPAARLRAASLCLETWCWGGYLNCRQLRLLCWLLRHLHHLLKGMYKLDIGRNIKGVPTLPKDVSKMTCILPYATPVAGDRHNNSIFTYIFHLSLCNCLANLQTLSISTIEFAF